MSKKNDPNDISGFKEVLDIIEEKKTPPPIPKSTESYVLYSFLEHEQRRLIALDDLLSKKYINMKNFPQTEKLLVNEIYKRNLLKEDLFEKLKSDDSPLNKHLEQIFNSVYK